MINLLKHTNVATEIIKTVLGACDIDTNDIERIDDSIFFVDKDGKRIKMCLTNDKQGVSFLVMDSEDEINNNLAQFTINYGENGFVMDGIAYAPNGKTIYLQNEGGTYIKCLSYNTEDIINANESLDSEVDKVSVIFNPNEFNVESLGVANDSCYLTYVSLEDLAYIFRDFYQDQDTYSQLFSGNTITF